MRWKGDNPLVWFTWINPTTHEFSISWFIDRQIWRRPDLILYQRFCWLLTWSVKCYIIISKFFLAYSHFNYNYLIEKLHPSNSLHDIPCFIVLLPMMFCSALFKMPWNDTSRLSHFTGIPSHIYPLWRIQSLITNNIGLILKLIKCIKN